MRPQQHNNKRGRNRNRRHGGGGGSGGGGGGNPLNRVYESNGPDVKVRGTAQTVAEKYLQLARDAQVSGDYVMSENYFQHAEHYLRILAAAQAYNQQVQAQYRPQGEEYAEEGEGDDGPDGDEQPGAVVERLQQAPALPDDGFDTPQPHQQQREFRPRNENRERFRNFRQDRPNGSREGGYDNQQDSAPRGPRPADGPAQPERGDAQPDTRGEPSWGDGPQPSFLKRPSPQQGQGRQRFERRRREPAAEEGGPATPAPEETAPGE